MALTREAVAQIFQDHSYAVVEGRFGKPGEWADKVLALADEEPDSEPCKSEIWSWDYFRPEQVDPYWIRCTRLGWHNDEHEDSNTGATWTGD